MLLQPFDDSGRMIYGGVDLSSTTDLTSFAMLQRRDDGGWNCNWRYWLPEERLIAAERKDNVPYRHWEEQGYLTVTPGARINQQYVSADIRQECQEHGIWHIGYDPWNAERLQQDFEEDGLLPVQVRQGYASLSEPSKNLEACVAEGTFKHGGNPISRWCAENVETQTDVNGNIRPVKPDHGSTKRIDGIVATIIAIAVAIVVGDDVDSSYAEPGSLAL